MPILDLWNLSVNLLVERRLIFYLKDLHHPIIQSSSIIFLWPSMACSFKRTERQNILQNYTLKTNKKIKEAEQFYKNNKNSFDLDMTEQQVKKAALYFMNNLRHRADRKFNIVVETIGQHENHLRRQIRKDSNFGIIIKRKPKIRCHNLIIQLLVHQRK